MDDMQSLENVINELKYIEDNNWDNMDHLNSVEMLLTSNNNGTDKDDEISDYFTNLKDIMQEAINTTNNIMSLMGEMEE
ncbi:hypothetical protein [Clostridiisalibacter paucivorans]|uniref:hypothetical protein n=1 Tax=Clostridiisalibacter paucivorans TaxID=408753 RepID=UPI00047E1BFC|nr:hypothetical protein [Clostridiisalibacter paucivorans]